MLIVNTVRCLYPLNFHDRLAGARGNKYSMSNMRATLFFRAAGIKRLCEDSYFRTMSHFFCQRGCDNIFISAEILNTLLFIKYFIEELFGESNPDPIYLARQSE